MTLKWFLQFIRLPSSKVGKTNKSWVISIPSIQVVIVYFQSLWKNVDPDQVVSSEASIKQPLSERQKIGFQDQLSLIAGQKYCRMLQNGAFCNTFDLH